MKKIKITILLLLTFISAMTQTMVREGLAWTNHTWCDFTGEDLGYNTVWFEFDHYEGNDAIFQVYDTPGKEPLITEETMNYGQICQIGEKVYFKKYIKFSDGAPEEWRLMYDFALQPGESAIVYAVEPGYNNPTRSPEQVTCLSLSSTSFPNWESMNILNLDLNRTEVEDWELEWLSGTWVKGLGSVKGVLDNIHFGWISGYTHNTTIKENGEFLISFGPTEPAMVGATNDYRIKFELQGRSLTVYSENGHPVTVNAIDGNQVTRTEAGEPQLQVVLKHAGVYMVSTNGKTKKIIVR